MEKPARRAWNWNLPRKEEVIGGGYIVMRRHSTSNRLSIAPVPFEHPDMDSALRQAHQLSKAHPGKRFYVLAVASEAVLTELKVKEDA